MAIQWITWKKAKAFYLSIHLLNKPFLSRAPALNLSLKAIRRYDWLKASLYDSFEPIIIVIIECSPALYVMHWFWPQRYWCHSAMGEVPLKDELKRRMLLRFYFRYPRLCPHVLCLTSVASLTTHKKLFSKYCPCLVEHGLMISSPLSGARGAGWWWKCGCVRVWESLWSLAPWLVFQLAFASKMFKRLCALLVP